MRAWNILGALALGAAIMAPGLADAQTPQFFRIGTGGAGGTYFPIGGIIATGISNPPGSRPCDKGGACGVPGLVAIVQSSDGSVGNVNAVSSGQMESGIAQSDVTHWAYTGTGLFEGKPKVDSLRVIANLFPEHIQVFSKGTGCARSIEQLKGSLETLLIKFGTPFLPVIRKIVDAITKLLNDNMDAIGAWADRAAAAIDSFLPQIMAFADAFMAFFMYLGSRCSRATP